MRNLRGRVTKSMPVKISERYANTPDCKVPISSKYKRNIIDIAKAFFRTKYRSTVLNREDWRFDVRVVDAEPAEVKQFMEEHTMCFVENTFSQAGGSGFKVESSKRPTKGQSRQLVSRNSQLSTRQ